MKIFKRIKTKFHILLLLFISMSIVLMPLYALAGDADNDGIPDEMEGTEICLPFGTDSNDCYLTEQGKADVFIIFKPADPTNSSFPVNVDPLSFIISNPDINLHRITEDQAPDQIVMGSLYAVKLIENTTISDGAVGISSTGTTDEKNYGFVYTKRIIDDVNNACDGASPILLALGSDSPRISDSDEIAENYILNVAAHETFHMLGRVMPPNRKVAEHYNQQGYIMDHHMYYTEKKGKVTWYITDAWTDADIPRYK